jgi:hypothetical protein
MNTALSWIKAYVPDLDVTAQEYTDAMTLTGTKVEGYTCLDKNLEKIVVGEILEVKAIRMQISWWYARLTWERESRCRLSQVPPISRRNP